MPSITFFDDVPRSGPLNMAIDEALLEQEQVSSGLILRFYRWSPATLSLGYFQKYEDRFTHQPSSILEVVRRASGGGAIIHDHELTYSLIVPIAERWGETNKGLYVSAHSAIIKALAKWNIIAGFVDLKSAVQRPAENKSFLCFQRRSEGDLVIGNNKIAGSAQRRGRRALLQHGSILLKRSDYAPELPGIVDLARQEVSEVEFSENLTLEMSKEFGLPIAKGLLPDPILDRAKAIQAVRYGSDFWVKNR